MEEVEIKTKGVLEGFEDAEVPEVGTGGMLKISEALAVLVVSSMSKYVDDVALEHKLAVEDDVSTDPEIKILLPSYKVEISSSVRPSQ